MEAVALTGEQFQDVSQRIDVVVAGFIPFEQSVA
jgi:hypothetical protein